MDDRADECAGDRDAEDAVLQELPFVRRMLRFVGALFSLLMFALLVGAAGLAFLFGTRTGEDFVRGQTTAALSRLLGPSYEASLGKQTFEFRPDGTLAINWAGVTLHRKDRPDRSSEVRRVSVALRLMPLAGGSLEFGRLEIDGARIDLAAFGETPSERYRRVSAVQNAAPAPRPPDQEGPPRSMISRTADSAIRTLERQLQALQAYHFDTVSFQDIAVEGLPSQFGTFATIDLRQAELHRSLDGALRLTSRMDIGPVPVSLTGMARFDPESAQLQTFDIRSSRIEMEDVLPPAPRSDKKDERPFGTSADVSFEAGMQRDPITGNPVLQASLRADQGELQLGLNHTRIEKMDLRFEYRDGEDRLQLLKSPMRFDDVSFDAEGTLEPLVMDGAVDPSKLQFRFGSGNILSHAGQTNSSHEPLSATLWVDGQIDPAGKTGSISKMELLTGGGRLGGDAIYRGSAPDALTSLRLDATDLTAPAVKAFWPFLISGKARSWVIEHLGDDGLVPNGAIAIDVRRDRLKTAFKPDEEPSESELRVDVDLRSVDLSTIGTVPRALGAEGRVETRGGTTRILIDGATLADRPSIQIGSSTVTLSKPKEGNRRNLDVALDLTAAGDMPDILAVADAEPIHALRTLKLDPATSSGLVDAKVSASLRLGDEIAKEDQLRDWSVEAELKKADPGQPIQGRHFSDLAGTLRVIPGQASGSFDGTMDGLPAKLGFAIPFGEKPIGTRRIDLGLNVSSKKAADFVPALADVVDGPIKADVTEDADGLRAEVELTDTALALPVIAWKKGAGIAAKLSFAIDQGEGGTVLRDIDLRGQGFTVNGSVSIDGGGLASATLTDVSLNPGDDVNVKVERHSNGYGIQVAGKQFDARPILAQLKAGLGKKKDGDVGGGTFDITADVDRLNGFGDRAVSDFSLNYASSKGKMAALNLGGRTGAGALSGDLSPRQDSRAIRIASDDAGALLEFAGLYGHMEGGRATLNLLGTPDSGYRGELQMRDFTLVDEPRLSRIVGSSPAPNTASPSQALGQDLRTERAFFDHASAKLAYDERGLRVADGIVRGPIFGSSFIGTLYDSQSRIDIAGSFMPAYGINRVFGSIPILGQLLGNGNEGGLIGITYHLSGPFASPTLVVNPISAIAPGIFRQIFSYD